MSTRRLMPSSAGRSRLSMSPKVKKTLITTLAIFALVYLSPVLLWMGKEWACLLRDMIQHSCW